MIAPRSHPCWFLLESEAEKQFRAICNYLSLGQFELARSLLRINFEEEVNSDSFESLMDTNASKLLFAIIVSGPPDSWICSDSVPSTAHLLCMCKDFLRDIGISVDASLNDRCEFDLMISMALMESRSNLFASEFATELRIRYCNRILVESKCDSLILPRLLVTSECQFLVLPGVALPLPRRRDTEPQLSSDLTDYLFRLCVCAGQTGIGLLEYLHEVSPIISCQLTHIQAALVANCLLVDDWKGVCTNIRFLNEFGDSELLTSSPLLTDLCSLLVFVSNCRDGQSIIGQKKELGHQISKFISDCVSPTYGSFPFITKKRRPCFSLGSMLCESYYPNEPLRLGLYESLSSRESDSCLIDVVARLEDALLSLYCEKRTLPPCFDSDHPVPFWDAYSDFVRMAKVHCVRYPLETAVELVRKREFDLAERLLVNFNQLRPGLILLCWDDFGVDLESRAALLRIAWQSYLRNTSERCRLTDVEGAVWGIARRFQAALALAKHYRETPDPKQRVLSAWTPMPGEAESVIDIMRQLPDHSILFVLRSVAVSLTASGVVPWLMSLPASGKDAVEDRYDLDMLRAYFALRGVVTLVMKQTGTTVGSILSETHILCESIERDSIKRILLEKILHVCFWSLFKEKKEEIVDLGVLLSLICLVCSHSSGGREAPSKFLITFLVCLKESARYMPPQEENLNTVASWARLVNADLSFLAPRGMENVVEKLPTVIFSPLDSANNRFVSPPRCSMGFTPDKFVPRLTEEPLEIVKVALAMNDYALAHALFDFFKLEKDNVEEDASQLIAEAENFKNLRDGLRAGLPLQSYSQEDPLLLIDLAVSGNAPAEVSLAMLRAAQPSGVLAVWAGKLAVLLEAKTEFRSNVVPSVRVDLAEVILGIETLPNEPELLKDHLSRMHSQRSAIMALVDRVDQVRRGQVNEAPDFLSEAIKRLTREGLIEEGLGRQSSSGFLIRFLEYLSKVCSLVQEAARGAVSLFDVLSEEPVDLVARIVFQHKGFAQARALCELMHMHLLSIVESQSVPVDTQLAGKYYISLELVRELTAQVGGLRTILLCLQRRSKRWPCSQLLQHAYDQAEILDQKKVRNWIQERQNCWKKFLFAFRELHGFDASLGFSLEEESELPIEEKLALRAVATGSQNSMDALAKLAACAHMHSGNYIAALCELDSNLSVKDVGLINDALMGCLTSCHEALSPGEIYELLWRVPDCETLLRLSLDFYKSWHSEIAVKVLELCADRLSSDDSSDQLEHVMHLVRVIRTMTAVAEAIGSPSWQSVEKLSSSEECVSVISSLIHVCEHSLAVEFLDLKSAFVDPHQLDLQADVIELSRLRHIFLSHNNAKLLDRLLSCHHPVKASRLALRLMDSIDSVSERTRLGYLLLGKGIACEEDGDRLNTQLASLALFALTDSDSIRDEWKSFLVHRPDLLLESLLMNGRTDGVESFLLKFPCWRNDALVLELTAKAIGLIAPPSHSCVSRDTGLGGMWSLTGSESQDMEIRNSHFFAMQVPDMKLALNLLNLLCRSRTENAVRIFSFANQLSLFIHDFFENQKNIQTSCPFKHFAFLRQAIVALIRVIQDGYASREVAVASEHGIPNIKLIVDLWTRARIRVGLSDLSEGAKQVSIRDQLIDMDQLELAERVCYAAGRNPSSETAADVVTIKRATLLIQAGETARAMTVLEQKLNRRKLSSDQLAQLEHAVRTRPHVKLKHLKQVHEILTCVELSRKLRIASPVHHFVPKHLPPEVRCLLPPSFVEPFFVNPSTTCSHMSGDISSPRCASCQVAADNYEEDEGVCISTPRLVETEAVEGETVAGCFDEIISIFEKFGDPCSVLSLLIREGQLEKAVSLAIKHKQVSETVFVQAVVDAGGCRWGPVLTQIRNFKDLALPFLTAIEMHLRSVGDFPNLYECEVAMGREAAAGIVAIHLYLRTHSWEERLGWLESSVRHLDAALTYKTSKRFLQRRRKKLTANPADINSSSEEENEEDTFFFSNGHKQVDKISVPFLLPFVKDETTTTASYSPVLTEAHVLSIRALAELQLEVTKLLPSAPVSASLFGSIQSVSEAIDFLLMEGEVRTAKSIVNRLRLPDDALCGIFHHL